MRQVDDASPFAGTAPVASLSTTDGSVTLVEARTFSVSGRSGDVTPGFPHGLFVLDSRVLSQWQLRLNGHPLEPLTVAVTEPFAATFVGRGHPPAGHADANLVCFRHRHIGQGMRERLVITNHGLEPAPLELELRCDVDFAGLFEVKENRVRPRGRRQLDIDHDQLVYRHHLDGVDRAVQLHLPGASMIDAGRAWWHRTLAPGETFELCLQVTVHTGDRLLPPRFVCDGPDDDALPSQRMASWRASMPTVTTDNPHLARAVARTAEDLGALRIFDPDHPDVPILAAGAPWFMTVFGRDSLLTSWMTLLADPSLAIGVLDTLARFQGRDVVDETEEEPGKILHEMRFGASAGESLGGGEIYYGTIDATPLFVIVLDEVYRWTGDRAFVERMLPHAERAMAWIEQFGDRDGDGFVEYGRRSAHGLVNQGWKDSWDAIRHLDGTLAQGPIALCEVQGYVYAAYRARAGLARVFGDDATFERYQAKAAELRRRFNEAFWLEDRGWYALALDGDKRPVEALASNMGHCLWAGIVDRDRAGLVADRLLSPELFSGWGVRTLATSMPAYNPVSYHNGSVWPHDNALCIAGLSRYGFMDHAHRVIAGQLGVAAAFDSRLPELFAGFDRDELPVPAAYPTSCSPQAWASAAPLLWLRSLLRLDPLTTEGQLWMHPELPSWIRLLRVEGIRVGERHVTVEIEDGSVRLAGTNGLRVVTDDPEVLAGDRPWPHRPDPLTSEPISAGDGT